MRKIAVGIVCAAIALSACSREQGDWEKARAANNTDAYELFIKKYPGGEFSAQAQARVKELYEERDWQKARDTDSLEAYQNFIKQHPEGKWTEEARIRVENFSMAQSPAAAPAPGAAAAGAANAAHPETLPGWESGPNGDAASVATPPPAAAAVKAAPSVKQAPAVAPPAAAAPPPSAAVPAAAAGAYAVQLGAFRAGAAAANSRWSVLQTQFPSALAGLKHHVAPAETDAGTLYKLQVRGLAEAKARSICQALKAGSQPCLLVPPAH